MESKNYEAVSRASDYFCDVIMWNYPERIKSPEELSKFMGDIILSTNPIREKIALLTVLSTTIYFESIDKGFQPDGGLQPLRASVDHAYESFHEVERRYKNRQPFKILVVCCENGESVMKSVSIKPSLKRRKICEKRKILNQEKQENLYQNAEWFVRNQDLFVLKSKNHPKSSKMWIISMNSSGLL